MADLPHQMHACNKDKHSVLDNKAFVISVPYFKPFQNKAAQITTLAFTVRVTGTQVHWFLETSNYFQKIARHHNPRIRNCS